MNETKSTVKGLKKQMAAAVAMVTVAAVALGSSTYAWFVSNNTVTAKTTNISAMSNSAYLVIDKVKTTDQSQTEYSYQTDPITQTALYPAQVIANGVWESAYAANPGASTEQDNTRFQIKSDGQTTGSAEAAVAGKYAITEKFFIGTGGYDGEFTDLVVSNMTLSAPAKDIANAMRVLVKCGNNWQVWKYDAQAGKGVQVSTYKTTAEEEEVTLSGQAAKMKDKVGKTEGDAEVDVYIYYDGADTNIKSDNLSNLAESCGVTLTFSATPSQPGNNTQA